ncbi:hypothetical protein [Zhihengliuella halotolerans]|uniref:Uncharacterized protein n=1 Tax=Zhihengliuella halotolerans TaxID=370736 RepID=A0A4V2G9Z1_9MICC|nr:hypothetical protein [Zhihengliuella halotolerans]RZU62236.1 hypothetical protein EV380_1829 [Zhihengliuella halotolerans]
MVELTVAGSNVGFREASCENSDRMMRETTMSGMMSGNELMWDDKSLAPAQLTTKAGGLYVQAGYFEPEDYAPATDDRAADGLHAFIEACGAPFPRS